MVNHNNNIYDNNNNSYNEINELLLSKNYVALLDKFQPMIINKATYYNTNYNWCYLDFDDWKSEIEIIFFDTIENFDINKGKFVSYFRENIKQKLSPFLKKLKKEYDNIKIIDNEIKDENDDKIDLIDKIEKDYKDYDINQNQEENINNLKISNGSRNFLIKLMRKRGFKLDEIALCFNLSIETVRRIIK